MPRYIDTLELLKVATGHGQLTKSDFADLVNGLDHDFNFSCLKDHYFSINATLRACLIFYSLEIFLRLFQQLYR